MKITKVQLRRIIKEAFTTVSDQDFDKVTMPGYKGAPPTALKDYSDEAIQAAAYAIEKVPYPQGAMIENEIHSYLESDKGLDPNSDEIFTIADEALEVAGIMLDVGPDAL